MSAAGAAPAGGGVAADAPARRARAADLGLLAALALLGAALHGPWITRPFGPMEINGANFFGPFALNFAKFGFWELRGAPLGPFELGDPARGIPYLNHPPGFAWLCASLGTEEWQLRLPTVLGAILSGQLLFLLLRPSCGRAPAFLGAAALLATPMLAFFCVTSYENAVLPLGLLAWWALLAAERALGARRAAWRAVLVAAAIAGAWLDWQFGFLVAALAPLAAARQPATVLRRLALPWLAAAASLGGVVLWAAWAIRSPRLPPGLDLVEIGEQLLFASALHPPTLGEFVAQSALRVSEGFTAPLLGVALLGLVPLVRRAPRLAFAGLLAGVLNPVLLPPHSMAHVIYWAYFGPLVGGACAALVAAAAARGRRLGLAAGALVAAAVVWAAIASAQHLAASHTTFFRDYGEALTRATTAAAADGAAGGATVAPERRYAVVYNTRLRYGYYVRSDYVMVHPTTDVALLEQHRVAPADYGIRYLLLQLEGSAMDQYPSERAPAALVEYLSPFPRQVLTELEGAVVRVPGKGLEARVARAWLVTLRE